MMQWVADMLRELPLPVALATSRAAISTDLRPVLAKIDRPVLILHGDKDVSAPLELTGRRTAAGINGAVLKVYPGRTARPVCHAYARGERRFARVHQGVATRGAGLLRQEGLFSGLADTAKTPCCCMEDTSDGARAC